MEDYLKKRKEKGSLPFQKKMNIHCLAPKVETPSLPHYFHSNIYKGAIKKHFK